MRVRSSFGVAADGMSAGGGAAGGRVVDGAAADRAAVGRMVDGAAGGAVADRAAERAAEGALELLTDRPLVVLTGAGVSTDSGIPDYRGPLAPARRPMSFQEFVSGPDAQRRYWARSHLGWSRMRGATPNAGHHALARTAPRLLITQNVDGLHEAAGSHPMVALHGRIGDVVCLDCGVRSSRARLQAQLTALNPGFAQAHAQVSDRPDGDVDLDDTAGFRVPDCEVCGGTLKPDVVFFGENVPAARVEGCSAAVDALSSSHGVLLVVGSSLTVMSGFRFVRRAAAAGIPVVIVNRGATRGDAHATYKVDAGCSEFLTALAAVRAAAGREPSLVSPVDRGSPYLAGST